MVAKKAPSSTHEGYRLVSVDEQHGAVCTCGEQSQWLPSPVAADEWWIDHLTAVGEV